MLPNGDQYKLEEGRIGLSGGQKARVALARAVYSPSRILLDDPLAALDHDTAGEIVHRFLQGPLAKGRTVVMATHRDDLVLRLADQVVDMKNGKATVLTREQIKIDLENLIYLQPYSRDLDKEQEPHYMSQDLLDLGSLQESPEEPAETGSVSLSIYLGYMRAGGWLMWVLLILSYSASRYCDISRARLLEAWGNFTSNTSSRISNSYWGLPNPEENTKIWLTLLGSLSFGQIIIYATAQLLAKISVDAAQSIFTMAIERISKATLRYLDVTPTSQLKNRLIADIGMVDDEILSPLESFVYNLIALVLSIVAISIQQPLLVILGSVAVLFIHFFRAYVPATRCLRRMEMRYLTLIIANIGVMQDSLVTIRAFQVERHFRARHLQAVGDFQKHDHFFWSLTFWLNFRLRIASACTRTAVILWMIWMQTTASAVGYVLTQTLLATTCIQQLCERFAQLQLDAVCLERVNLLNKIPEEPVGNCTEPPDDWPKPSDAVCFNNFSFRYADDLPNVIEKVSFEIPGGAACAVLGRTGSGKSTIANALLVTETASEGNVKVGGVDLALVNRTTLRTRITFIQQDPTLFPGTLHDNLDPEGKFSDQDCLKAIRRVLGPTWALSSPIDAGDKNLSPGQRQLVGIGRAVLHRSGLVILDEATASIDRATAATVQRILREELSKSTVITIAHRLEAVASANWCLRLERGRVIECGPALGFEKHGNASKND